MIKPEIDEHSFIYCQFKSHGQLLLETCPKQQVTLPFQEVVYRFVHSEQCGARHLRLSDVFEEIWFAHTHSLGHFVVAKASECSERVC